MRSHILSTASLQKGNPSPGTYKKKDAKRRSSRKSDSATVTKSDQPTSQWYTTTEISHSSTCSITSLISNLHSTPVFELRQEVTSLTSYEHCLFISCNFKVEVYAPVYTAYTKTTSEIRSGERT